MSFSFKVFVFSIFFVSFINAQDSTREQKLQKIDELNGQIRTLETAVLSPDAEDIKEAAKESFEVFRLMPQEKYDRKLTTDGSGEYYSFTTKSHDYQKIAQIRLEQNYLSVGFAGADYGFIFDLGSVSLANTNEENSEIKFLSVYKPPAQETQIRDEQRKTNEYETKIATYRRRVPVIVEHVYALRAISFDDADVLVAFKIYRKDTDGSLIIFWKLLKTFETPTFIRKEQSSSTNNIKYLSAVFAENPDAKIEAALRKKGFSNVKVDSSTKPMTLRGTVPKGKLAEVIEFVMELNGGKPVRNELTEK